MNAAARLGLYAAGLVVAFTAAFLISGAVTPNGVVDRWLEQDTGTPTHDEPHE